MKRRPETVILDTLTGCARCGGIHDDIEFKRFRNPVVDNDTTVWAYWATCPATGDPILLKQQAIEKSSK